MTLQASTFKETSIAKLQARHLSMIRMHLGGCTYGEISQALGVSPQSVESAIRSPLAQARIAEMQSKLDNQAMKRSIELETLADKSLEILAKVLNGSALETEATDEAGIPVCQMPTLSQRLKVAETVLDRTPNTAKVTKAAPQREAALSTEAIDALKARYAEMRGLVVDAEFSSVESPSCDVPEEQLPEMPEPELPADFELASFDDHPDAEDELLSDIEEQLGILQPGEKS